jgi:hypothetical protein
MTFAASRNTLRSALAGIFAEVQGTDYSEISKEVGALPVFFLLCPQFKN